MSPALLRAALDPAELFGSRKKEYYKSIVRLMSDDGETYQTEVDVLDARSRNAIQHLAAEERMSHDAQVYRLAQVTQRMNANHAVGFRLMFFIVPAAFGVASDFAMVVSTCATLAVLVYVDSHV